MSYFFDFKKEISTGKLKKHIVFFGDEFYFFKEVRRLLKKFAAKNKMEFEIYYLDEMEFQEGIERASSNSFFSSRRMIVFKNPQKVKFSEKEEKLLVEAMEGDNFLIFEYPFGYNIFEKGNRRGLENFLIKKFTVYNLRKLNEYYASKKVVEFLKKRNFEISDKCLNYLVKKYNSELDRIFKTLENFFLYFAYDDKPKKVITLKDIEPFLYYGLNYTPSQLVEAIMGRDLKKIFEISGAVKGDISFMMSTVGLLSWYFQKMFFYMTFSERGWNYSEIMSSLKLSDRNFKEIINRSKKFKLFEIERYLKGLRKLDEVLKSGSKVKDIFFQKMIFQLFFFDVEY